MDTWHHLFLTSFLPNQLEINSVNLVTDYIFLMNNIKCQKVKQMDIVLGMYKFDMSMFQFNEANYKVTCDELPKPTEDL